MERKVFEEKIQPILSYVGAIGAAIMSVAYIIIVFVLIQGFKAEELLQITIFAIVNAAVGFCIMQFLKIQGISFAEQIPENQEILKEYYNKKTKDKKLHSIRFYWVTSVTKDVFVKALTLGASTVGIIYILIEGSNDWAMLGLAFVNLLMFICFGLLALNAAYNFFNNRHIPYVKEQIKQVSQQETEKEEETECSNLETKSSETCNNK